MSDLAGQLARIAAALERISPPPPDTASLAGGGAFIWRPGNGQFDPQQIAALPLDLLRGVERQKAALQRNTARFATGEPANHALLWGVRGAGKSALIRAVLAQALKHGAKLAIVEAPLGSAAHWPGLIAALAATPVPVVLTLDDLGAASPAALQALKPALDGGLTGGRRNILVYATANRRHLVARASADNADHDPHLADAAQDQLALQDRFGLWLGFHSVSQPTYLEIVAAYAETLGLKIPGPALQAEAIAWAAQRGARSGRVAWQFILDAAAREGVAVGLET
jgi:uncharacterized protein